MRKILWMVVGFALIASPGIGAPPSSPGGEGAQVEPANVDVQPPVRILFPQSKTYVTQANIECIGTVSEPSLPSVTLRVSHAGETADSQVAVSHNAFAGQVALKPGLNQVQVLLPGGESPAVELQIFYQTDDNRSETPPDFKPYYLHPALEQKSSCEDCHRLDTVPADFKQMNVLGVACQTEACHQNIGTKKYVHGPAAGGTCIACHNPHGSVNKYEVSRDPQSLCLVCHEDKAEELTQPFVHKIITMSGCTDCHDPHESPYKFQLRAGTTSELCFTCHDDSKVKQAVVHGPVASGDCNVCHNPHAAPNKYQLIESGNDLCFLCHDTIQEDASKQNKHQPVQEDCTTCHDPHSAPKPKLLGQAQASLCLDCHDEVQEQLQTVTVSHPPVAEGQCTACHAPHGSDETKLLVGPLAEVCFQCHQRLGKEVKTSQNRHGPVRENDCVACHAPHGSTNPKILKLYFPAEFYKPYSPENYALCFECHEEDIALDEYTTTLTGFRNGDRNLHYLHVHKARKGRSCKACHAVHASNQPLHIRTEVPYGKMWSYPIQYTRTEQGGKCVVGCHKPKEYNRVEPVAYK